MMENLNPEAMKLHNEATSVKVSRMTLLWLKRLNSLMTYRIGTEMTLNVLVVTLVTARDLEIARELNLTDKELNEYITEISNKMAKDYAKRGDAGTTVPG